MASAPGRFVPLVLVALALVVGVAYVNSCSGPFVFDDYSSIVANPTIRYLDWTTLSPPNAAGETVGGRPLLNWSFALNYAIGGLAVGGYHAVNLAIHLAAALVLFGLLRRTLELVRSSSRSATLIAAVAAAGWAAHPLQTESVTYVVQRAESLAGLFYLLTIYGVVRSGLAEMSEDRAGERRWSVVAVLACAGGMATKEIAATAPLLALLYDRTFLAGSVRQALRRRGRLYAALAATWSILWWSHVGAPNRGGTAGWTAGISAWRYLLTQTGAIVRYLELCVWPRELVFDYGTATARGIAEVALPCAFVAAVIAAAVVLLFRRRALGFAVVGFLLVLAPSSSVLPIASQTVAEHRLYLPIAFVVASVVAGLVSLVGRLGLLPLTGAILAFTALTAQRNTVYHDRLRLWNDTIAKRPDNSRARDNLAVELIEQRRYREAIVEDRVALALQPDFAEAHNNLAVSLSAVGCRNDAMAHLRAALRLKPDYAGALNNLGKELMAEKITLSEAIAVLDHARRASPNFAEAETNLSLALVRAGRASEAVGPARRAIELDPSSAEGFNNLGVALASSAQVRQSVAAFARAAELAPNSPTIRENWAKALQLLGRDAEADAQRQFAASLQAKRADP